MNEREIFSAALDIEDPAERAAYLDRACAGDPTLRHRLAALLGAHQPASSFLERPAEGLMATLDESPVAERPGTAVGPYKLLQQIGEGGMGVVYMAEQTEPVRRRVALKIIKPGMDSAQVVARFEAERQAIALMDHQNIARVYDAGTTDTGRPFFVMELVHGVPITRFCDDNKLTPRERLELFVPVCQAVQHAHQKGVIHRDLKPSNVLVCLYDGKPVPKIIDFGVAKATSQPLTARTMFTQFGTLVGTLEYMSPEQAGMSQLGIDTRSDVYSLGVLLYELLTGTTPLERSRLREVAFDELLRIIREEEPLKPSTRLSSSGAALADISAQRNSEPGCLTRLVRGELDWIVMKALEKDRNRRYETANSLARDVERYLKDEPVEACPPTAGYRMRKFARKNRKLLVTAAAFAALLLLGAAGSTWQAMRATQAEDAAVVNAVQAKEKEQEANQQRNQARDQRDEAQRKRNEVQALNETLRKTEARLRHTLYTAHMNLAQRAWDAGGVERARELLDLHRPGPGETDLRGFEWHYLDRLCRAEILTLRQNSSLMLQSMAMSPDGKRLATAGLPTEGRGRGNAPPKEPASSEVQVWDVQSGKLLFTLKGAGGRVAFSPDGKHLASEYPETKVWDAQTGTELLSLKGGGSGLAYSSDGKRLASASTTTGKGFKSVMKEVKVWDAITGDEIRSIECPVGSRSFAFSPDGNSIATVAADGNTLTVWDVKSGKEQPALKAQTQPFVRIAFSPDGNSLATTTGGNTVTVWDVKSGKELLALTGNTRGFGSIVFCPDGNSLAATEGSPSGNTIVWNTKTGKELFSFQDTGGAADHFGGAGSVAFSPDGKRLVTTEADANTIRVRDAKRGQELFTLKGARGSPAYAVFGSPAFSADGKLLAAAGTGNGRGVVRVWDVRSPNPLILPQGGVVLVALSPNGKRLATAELGPDDFGVTVWDALSSKKLFTLKVDTIVMTGLAFSPDGKRLAFGSGPGNGEAKAIVWDAQTGEELITIKGAGGSVAFGPDGKTLVSTEGGVRVWDAQTGKPLRILSQTKDGGPGSTKTGQAVLSPDGKRLAGNDGTPGQTTIWDVETGKNLFAFRSPGRPMAFSPDGKRLAGVSTTTEMKVWDAETGKEIRALKGHTGPIAGVSYSRDGKRLASVSADGTLKVWAAHTGEELLSLKNSTRPFSVVFSPDGNRLIVNSLGAGGLKIWDATPLPEQP
jgi:WD40 repeat protein/serine/threonine protein kinase